VHNAVKKRPRKSGRAPSIQLNCHPNGSHHGGGASSERPIKKVGRKKTKVPRGGPRHVPLATRGRMGVEGKKHPFRARAWEITKRASRPGGSTKQVIRGEAGKKTTKKKTTSQGEGEQNGVDQIGSHTSKMTTAQTRVVHHLGNVFKTQSGRC